MPMATSIIQIVASQILQQIIQQQQQEQHSPLPATTTSTTIAMWVKYLFSTPVIEAQESILTRRLNFPVIALYSQKESMPLQ